ncbi:hypothetical protein SAMN02949497_4546 [Methylomagnum ishizawai]|uniref:UPF0250 protein SAMN02949497_4546 n=1 Tax=Methylomagnum ishizawai TaxID=1760988 RepID=A0A1Y6D3A2_9GAMM|nr:DUF493 domain-containing protein [Methylomagnum ishizawai]SMF97127.1 hypothetical protein SAMN02949497_4546 [Methylomagnum ishizawai]
MSHASPLQFPCEFPIKAFGLDNGGFTQLVAEIARRHAPGLDDEAVTSRPSKGGKYLSVTLLIQAENQAQLDAIYRDLSACAEVVMAL